MKANRKRAKVHMLPTEEKTDIIFVTRGSMNELRYVPTLLKEGLTLLDKEFKCQHLYITTDEEIKNGDKILWEGKIYDYQEFMSMKTPVYTDYFKIIATTNPKLTTKEVIRVGDRVHSEKQDFNDQIVSTESSAELYNKSDHYFKALPQIPQDFIKAYCEQGGIDEVDVEMEEESRFAYEGDTRYTLKVDPIHNTITTHRIVEKMYSREEVEELCRNSHLLGMKETLPGYPKPETIDEWIKENL